MGSAAAARAQFSQVVAVLQGEGTDNVTTKNGQVVVRLGPVVERVATALSNTGISFFDDIDGTPRGNRQIVLFESEDLRKTQGAVDLLDKVANYLPFVALHPPRCCACALSGDRRRTILRTALGIALGMALLLTLFNLGRTVYLDALPSSVRQDSAAAIYDQVLSFLRAAVRTAFVVAIVVAIRGVARRPRTRGDARAGRGAARADRRRGDTRRLVRRPLQERAADPRAYAGRAGVACSSC